MALNNFKNIVNRKGYLVDEDDRKVFESSIKKTNFELNQDDYLEFIMYDISDNQLPQGEKQNLVRYVPLTDENIRNYFITTNTNLTKNANNAPEFIVDVERLVNEAGYSNGRFKTQVSIVNRRVGFENSDENKMWIQEISPSRTEIRIVPNQRRGVINSDLEKRYSIITRDSQFRDDTIYKMKQYIESIDSNFVYDKFRTIKGKVSTGDNYIKLIQKEFKIPSFEVFVKQVRDKLVESVNYFVENREWRVNQGDYGRPISTPIDPELSIKKVNEIINSSFLLIVDKFLPSRNLRPKTKLTPLELKDLQDNVNPVLQTILSKETISSPDIDYTPRVVRGCTNENALNYNSSATEDDGSCIFRLEEPPLEPESPPVIEEVVPPIIRRPQIPPIPIVDPPIFVDPPVSPPVLPPPVRIPEPPVLPPPPPTRGGSGGGGGGRIVEENINDVFDPDRVTFIRDGNRGRLR